MNKQEIFNTVVTHLANQGKQSKYIDEDTEASCAYRGEEGTMCAVGCLIPDELYREELEGVTVYVIRDTYPEIYNAIGDRGDDDLYQLLTGLQVIHDNDKNWEDEEVMKSKLKRLAKTWKVKDTSVLNDVTFPTIVKEEVQEEQEEEAA